MELPWFGNPPGKIHPQSANLLIALWMRDADLGKTVARIPWLKEGVTNDEHVALLQLDALAREDVEAARLTASALGLPWLADSAWLTGQSPELHIKRIAFDALRTTSWTDQQSTALLLSLPWVSEADISGDQMSAITVVLELAQAFPEVAKEVLGFPWVRDGMTRAEFYALASILEIAWNDLDFAWHVLNSPFLAPPFLQRDEHALGALDWFSVSGPPRNVTVSSTSVDLDTGVRLEIYEGDPELLAHITGQSWFSDGLDDDDAALLHGLFSASGDFRQALIETNHVATAIVDLPLTGELGLAVVRHTPFPPEDETLKILEVGVRILEDFMGVPLPVGDVTLLLVEPEFWTREGAAGELVRFSQGGGPSEPAYVGGIIRVRNRETGPPTRTLFHELAHYYLQGGPRWLREGMANFLEAYIVARLGVQGLDERLAQLELSERCDENIWEHVNPYEEGLCDYELGEKFLLGMDAALGREAVSAALRELYAQALMLERLNHDSIYHAFQSNVPLGKEESFRTAWLRYHGSPVIDRPHADHPDRPALVALYNATDGQNWINNRNWLSDAPLGAWYGVYTNSQGQVTGLDLAKNGLSGELPSELGALDNLIWLIVRENPISGEILPELGDLINLVHLELDWNQLTGEIPPELGNLTNLLWLGLNGNRLSGEIPPELANLTKLRGPMWLTFSQFTGCIAAELPEIWVEASGLSRCEPAD